ncbi:pyridoxal phosphate-dependent aminotransferase [Rhizobiales bacterium]|uniref:pyridoxal phosphate-dependent aminotransferase n=1 Tax=Hongsoonwoonella zoysiae TaxID=2821844 RepID=UPI001560121B|nr:pyridoxal phosphate-dependent aminotransferase [Hongsoonwoonella zoysiae]NRG19580.1 pyridoxal phosphate-dependent aminotransferase [Hongsoonwoonella zoysiae]
MSLRKEAREAPESGIVEVVNFAREREDLIPLWVGEGDLKTPDFIREAAYLGLDAGETFYTYQRGIPELRRALADYHSRQYGRGFTQEEFYVTGSGMQAMQIAIQCVAGVGDEVILHDPAWPNLAAVVGIMGARAVPVPMRFSADGWSLDIDRMFDAVTPRTRAIYLNSPCNPTGWVAGRETLKAVLDRARQLGLWIIADEVYSRFVYGGEARAPSFYDVAEKGDRILYVNTFSKNWAMTGWRIGWLGAPAELGQIIENLIQYSTSGVAGFMQRAAIAALNDGDNFVEEQVTRAKAGSTLIREVLDNSERVEYAPPQGAFYLFFKVMGFDDSRELAKTIVSQTGVGLAPGAAFGPAGEGYLRLCFARSSRDLAQAAERLQGWLSR